MAKKHHPSQKYVGAQEIIKFRRSPALKVVALRNSNRFGDSFARPAIWAENISYEGSNVRSVGGAVLRYSAAS